MTILYIKTHNKTGLKYFGKSKKSFEKFKKYNGSGTYWQKHIKKHGNDITTRIYGVFEDSDDYFRKILCKVALTFSEDNNIVESDEWANLTSENGLDGLGIGHKFSEEHKKNRSESMKGDKHWNFGKTHSQETKDKIKLKRADQVITPESNEKRSATITGTKRTKETRLAMGEGQRSKPRVTCPHCDKKGAENLMKRYHFDNCKLIKL